MPLTDPPKALQTQFDSANSGCIITASEKLMENIVFVHEVHKSSAGLTSMVR